MEWAFGVDRGLRTLGIFAEMPSKPKPSPDIFFSFEYQETQSVNPLVVTTKNVMHELFCQYTPLILLPLSKQVHNLTVRHANKRMPKMANLKIMSDRGLK